jgi:hypothetical protein
MGKIQKNNMRMGTEGNEEDAERIIKNVCNKRKN